MPHEPNFTPTISISVLGYMFFESVRIRLILLILSMFLSDIFLGFHDLMIIIYLTLAFIILISNKKNYIMMIFCAPIIFFLISNFAVWIFSNMYAKNLSGLWECYVLALPFLKNSIISTFIFSFLTIYFFKINFFKKKLGILNDS